MVSMSGIQCFVEALNIFRGRREVCRKFVLWFQCMEVQAYFWKAESYWKYVCTCILRDFSISLDFKHVSTVKNNLIKNLPKYTSGCIYQSLPCDFAMISRLIVFAAWSSIRPPIQRFFLTTSHKSIWNSRSIYIVQNIYIIFFISAWRWRCPGWFWEFCTLWWFWKCSRLCCCTCGEAPYNRGCGRKQNGAVC